MKILLICLTLALAAPADAQPRGEILDENGNPPQIIVLPSLPDIDITVADLIDIAIEFTIINEDNPSFCAQFYGLTDYHSKSISICSRYDSTQKRKTFLHEVLHIMYRKIGWETGGPYEPFIHVKAEELFTKFYGVPRPA